MNLGRRFKRVGSSGVGNWRDILIDIGVLYALYSGFISHLLVLEIIALVVVLVFVFILFVLPVDYED